ncbi:hypothetical protein [Hydrogenophaga pseudoflava]|uniref:NADPH dehydrogenase n=1 Tax=Hydrogenophaga pseudoflava TaxID=47421 RepID=A0A4P6WXS7_HYDPS|nr:hypothetical protein [Hydrogenophaga pseudoflava]QBM26084.1 NADPH dehydrogenase [Hydrogenophaga pseudoflava]
MRNFVENRKYFFLAVNTGFAQSGLPDARCRDFYRERSRHGLHCSIVGNVVTPGGTGSNDVCAEISGAPAWRQLTESISECGALPGIQLASAWQGYQGMKRFVPNAGADPLEEYRSIATSLSGKDARAAFDGLYRGTEFAVKAGFRHVQIHAGHGYLFNLLVDPRLSRHSEFSLEEIRRWARDLAAMGIESSMRISIWAGHPVFDDQCRDQFFSSVAALPVSYVDVSAGFYNINKRLIYPSSSSQISDRVKATLAFASCHPETQVILSGKSALAWDARLPPNVHIGICRDLIANPNFLLDRARGCTSCMKCHYFSRGVSHLTCGQWEPKGN